jgi:hypothetical protein
MEKYKMRVIKFICLLALFISTNVISKNYLKDGGLTIEASLNENSSFAGMWRIKIKEFSDSSGAELEFSLSAGMGSRSFEGSSILGKSSLLTIKETMDKQEYFELPEFISPDAMGFDMPD